MNLYINHLACLDLVSECFLFLKTVNRATLLTFVFLTKQLHLMSTALPGPQHLSLSFSLFFFFSFKLDLCTAAHLFDMLTLNVSSLVFPQWASGEILKMPQVCAWPRTNISELIQTAERFGLGCSCLPRLLTSNPWVLAADCWHFVQFIDLYLSVLIYFCLCLIIYDLCVHAFILLLNLQAV